ncbi:MAG: hypothetical protein OEV28_05555, partial [Nitrospirota bacterium]|nr:hypothetical protein [Nitrospirota bacterium]
MKKIGKALLMVGAVSLVYAASASAMVTVTKHNFSSQGAEGQKVFLATPGDVNGEVCVFCHSPHVGQQVANAPLWNRAVASGNYTPYTSSTIDAPGVTSDRQPKGVSLACLSCHDGTIALDALRNAPGSGNFQDTPTTRGWSWSGLSGTNNAS